MAKVSREQRASMKRAWIRVVSSEPELMDDAIRNGLKSRRSLGYLELGAKLTKEIGAQEAQAPKVIIQLNPVLESAKNALRGEVIEAEPLALESRVS